MPDIAVYSAYNSAGPHLGSTAARADDRTARDNARDMARGFVEDDDMAEGETAAANPVQVLVTLEVIVDAAEVARLRARGFGLLDIGDSIEDYARTEWEGIEHYSIDAAAVAFEVATISHTDVRELD